MGVLAHDVEGEAKMVYVTEDPTKPPPDTLTYKSKR